jgi:hypothetical protein
MFPTTDTTQVITPFGSGYVPMEHSDPAHWNLAVADLDDVVIALRASMFSEVLRFAKCRGLAPASHKIPSMKRANSCVCRVAVPRRTGGPLFYRPRRRD